MAISLSYEFIACQMIVVLSCCELARSANILGVFPFKLRSHFIIYDALMLELANRGHNVTVISPFSKSRPPPRGFRDIDVSDCDSSPEEYDMEEVSKSHDPFYDMPIMFSLAELDRSTLECPPVRRLLASGDTVFDAVISELFCSTTMMAFATKFNVTSKIWFCPVSLLPWAADMIGNPHNPAYINYQYSSDLVMPPRDSTFYQRLYNTVLYLYAEFTFYWINLRQEAVKREYFNITVPSLSEIAKKVSLVFTFSHFTVNEPMPLLPNVIEVGGLHIKDASPLPENIEKFINDSEHGVIYFSLGSLLKSETMPKKKLDAFLRAFSKLPQRVLWKWGGDEPPARTNNILISKWMPQRDILAHSKVKLFIGHGGALGINEAVYEGVPVLGIPMYGDQTLNLKVLERQGGGEILEYTDINDESVMAKLEMMLNDHNKYSENMKRVSSIFRDRPMSPMDTAVYWVEYVIRHKGAPYMRSTAADMPLYQYLLLDILAFVVCLLCLMVMLTMRVFKLIFCRSIKSDNKATKKSK